MKRILNVISVVLVMVACPIVAAQSDVEEVQFEVKLSKKKLGINERLRVDFIMNKDGDNFNPPSFENFMAVGPNTAISNTWVNGKRSYSKTYSYFLTPKKRGTFTIGQATVEINGTVFKSVPVKVTVGAAIQKPKDPNDPDYIVSQNIHLVAEVSKTDPYLNEAITVVYKLYVSPNTGVSNWKEIDNPRYEDFWSQNIDMQGLKVQNGTYKGEDYRYVVLRKTVLYPQKTGKLNIEPLALDITVEVPTSRRDIFGGRLMQSVHKTVAAGRRTINVKPLPENGKPANFNGAVGDFNFEVSINKTALKATEALEASVEVSGNGNLKLFKLPKLNLPSALEVYEPERSERVRTNLGGMQGSISDNYTIVPSYQGKYPIPSINFSYFNPKTERYETITSEEMLIDVTEGPINQQPLISNASENENNVVEDPNKFASFKTNTQLVSTNSTPFFKSKAFWASLVSPILLIPAAVFIRRRNEERARDVIGNKRRSANRLAKKYLSEAKQNLGDKEPFYESLHRALHNYLKSKLSIETSEFSKLRISELLSSKGIEDENVEVFIELIESCEIARYTPSSDEDMQSDYSKAVDVVAALDKRL